MTCGAVREGAWHVTLSGRVACCAIREDGMLRFQGGWHVTLSGMVAYDAARSVACDAVKESGM